MTFELLDVAPIVGNVVNIAKETPLGTAANQLLKMIKTGHFFVSLQDPAFQNVSPGTYFTKLWLSGENHFYLSFNGKGTFIRL